LSSASTPNATSEPALSSTTEGYIKFTLGSVNYDYSGSGVWFSGTPSLSLQSPSPNYYTQSNTYNTSTKTNVFVLSKKDSTTQSGRPVSSTYFTNFFKVQNYSYASALTIPVIKTKGIFIKIKDNSNVYWSSINPVNSTSFQNGSTFNIVDKVEFIEVAPSTTIKFKATFNCKLYNSVGDSIMLTNGETITSYSNT